MKIGVVHVNTEEVSGPYTELITANLERAKSDGTEIMHRYVRHLRRATDTAIAYPTMLNKVDVVARDGRPRGRRRRRRDGRLLGRPGRRRGAERCLDIPVVGPMEAAHVARLPATAGSSGSSPWPTRTWSSNMDQMVQPLRLRRALRRAAPAARLPTATIFTEGFEKPEIVREDIEGRARELRRGRRRRRS